MEDLEDVSSKDVNVSFSTAFDNKVEPEDICEEGDSLSSSNSMTPPQVEDVGQHGNRLFGVSEANSDTLSDPVTLIEHSENMSPQKVLASDDRTTDLGVRKRKKVSVAEYTRTLDAKGSEKNTSLQKVKTGKILKCLAAVCSTESLMQFAISKGGLISDELRKRIWPILLGVDISKISKKPDKNVLQGHKDYEQVVLDVNRSLKRFPPGMNEDVRLSLQDQLVDCIMRVLVSKTELHYYQGYHDIVVTFLLVVGEDVTVALMQQLSMKHLRDFMYENMERTSSMLHYLYPLIGRCNPNLRNFMEKAEVGTMFCLPWLITWYGHVLKDIKDIVRLYDFFIACHPLMPIYLAAAIVQFRSEDILNCEPEMPFIHCLLSNIPDDLPFEELICHAGDLFVQYPPQSLEKEAKEQYEKAENENKLRQEQINSLKQKKMQKANSLWPFGWKKWNNNGSSKKSSILVKVTVWTSAAILSAAAVTLLNSYYVNAKSLDSWIDIPWMWGTR